MTLEGTNTWVVGRPGGGPVLVVDPGPVHDQHLQSIMACCTAGVALIMLTHRHHDHSDAAPGLARRAGCAVRAADPAYVVDAPALEHGERVSVPGAEVTVIATPGHTDDSVSLLVSGDDSRSWLLTGDMVLGRGWTVLALPDGDLASYLTSLDTMETTVRRHAVEQLLPGHGPVVPEPLTVLRAYRHHRLERLEQVRAALAGGARTAADIVAVVYADLDPALRSAAEQSVAVSLRYLSREGSG
jgi:glyoxylase-like metal-dependent hydrolase (beta-lactamase superfamily II)